MIVWLAKRLVSTAIMVFVVASAALLLATAAQGDYVGTTLGLGARQQTLERQRAALGLDRSPLQLYGEWLAGLARLDLGTSLLFQRPVTPLVGRRAANTALLAAAALMLAIGIGVPLGMITGRRRVGVVPAVVRGASVLCLSTPPLIASLLLVALAAATGLAPIGGMTSQAIAHAGWAAWLRDVAWHLPVPALALALPLAATLERIQSQALAEALSDPCIVAARARGLSSRRVLWRHAWRLGAKPVAATAGLVAGALLSGSFAVELVTAWPGLGRLTYDALVARDIYLAAGCATAAAVMLAAGLLASDVVLAMVDPRVRAASGAGGGGLA